jgi:hypothetical protein
MKGHGPAGNRRCPAGNKGRIHATFETKNIIFGEIEIKF